MHTQDIDPEVERLLREVQDRVARRRAAGEFVVDRLEREHAAGIEPFMPDGLAEVARRADVSPNLDLARSTRRGVGSLVSRVKWALARATSQPLIGVADEASRFNAVLVSYLSELALEVAALRARIAELEEDAQETPGR